MGELRKGVEVEVVCAGGWGAVLLQGARAGQDLGECGDGEGGSGDRRGLDAAAEEVQFREWGAWAGIKALETGWGDTFEGLVSYFICFCFELVLDLFKMLLCFGYLELKFYWEGSLFRKTLFLTLLTQSFDQSS